MTKLVFCRIIYGFLGCSAAVRFMGDLMKTMRLGFRWSALITGAVLLAATAGCAPGTAVPERILGSPAHHVENGLKLMQKGRLAAAHREFRMALSLDPRYAPAHQGDALVYAMRLDFDSAFKSCHRAIRHASREQINDPSLNVFSRIESLRWDRRAWRRASAEMETAFSARLFVVELMNEYHKLGVMFKFAGDPGRHGEVLERAFELTSVFSEKASFQLKAGRMLREKAPKTELARGVGFLDRVSRAEAAALLVREIGLIDRLGAKVGDVACPGEGPARPMDLNTHPLRDDVCVMLALDIHGFNLFEDRSFLPDSPMRRAEYAAAVMDILSRMGRDEELLRDENELKALNDVPESSPWFRAAAVCTDLNILELEEGRFRPGVPLSGMEAARSIHRIKELLGTD